MGEYKHSAETCCLQLRDQCQFLQNSRIQTKSTRA